MALCQSNYRSRGTQMFPSSSCRAPSYPATTHNVLLSGVPDISPDIKERTLLAQTVPKNFAHDFRFLPWRRRYGIYVGLVSVSGNFRSCCTMPDAFPIYTRYQSQTEKR